MKNKIKYIIFVTLTILIVEFIYYYQITKYYQKQSERHFKELIKLEEIKVNSSINTYYLVSEAIFQHIVNKEEILELFSKANTKDTILQSKVRDKLYKELEETYIKLKLMNIKQIQFHLPDNTSFLRFHSPQKFGDDLSLFRPTVSLANKTFKNQKGYEEGRTIDAFRYVQPLFYKNVHIGSVETSFSFEAVKNQLTTLGNSYVSFLIEDGIVEKKVFKDELKNYKKSKLTDEYYEEVVNINKNKDTLSFINELSKLARPIINEKISSKINFAVNIEYNEVDYIVSFINIKNLYNQHSAYVVTYNIDYQIDQIHNSKALILIIGLVGIPIIIVLISNFYINHLKIKEQNKKLIISEQELIELNKKLEDLNYSKDRFFSIISHDLRSPFSSIIGFSQLLHKNFDDFELDEVKESIGHIYSVSKKTYSLLENLLQWSKLQTSDFKPNLITLNLHDFVKDGIDLLKASAEQKSITINYNIKNDILILADREMLNLILRNLVGNAIKFTQMNGEIKLFAYSKDNSVHFEVTDNGVGMEKKIKDDLFKIDVKTSNAGTEGEKGSGLGLLLCKELAVKMGGDLLVESELGKGSKFTLLLKEDN